MPKHSLRFKIPVVSELDALYAIPDPERLRGNLSGTGESGRVPPSGTSGAVSARRAKKEAQRAR